MAAFSANIVPVSAGSGRPRSLAETTSTPWGASNSAISRSLPGLCVAMTTVPVRRRDILEAFAVEWGRRERRQIDAVKAPHVDRHHFRAVGRGSAGEGFDAARRTEQMLDALRPELVILQAILARDEFEIRPAHEGQQQAMLRANRAVASDHLTEARRRPVANLPAVAPARIRLWLGHVGLLVRRPR